MNHTLDYYNKNAQQFSKETISVDFTKTQDRFLNYLTDKGYILDFGCGSGRDTKYFLDKGFQVKAVDGSKELCRLAAEYTGIKVGQMLFEDLDEKEMFFYTAFAQNGVNRCDRENVCCLESVWNHIYILQIWRI